MDGWIIMITFIIFLDSHVIPLIEQEQNIIPVQYK